MDSCVLAKSGKNRPCWNIAKISFLWTKKPGFGRVVSVPQRPPFSPHLADHTKDFLNVVAQFMSVEFGPDRLWYARVIPKWMVLRPPKWQEFTWKPTTNTCCQKQYKKVPVWQSCAWLPCTVAWWCDCERSTASGTLSSPRWHTAASTVCLCTEAAE